MFKAFKSILIVSFITLSSVFAQGPITSDNVAVGTLPGTVKDRCTLKPPTRTAVTFKIEKDSDGFPFKFSAEEGSRQLHFKFRCNGAQFIVKFSHPQREAGSPPLAPNSNFYTEVSVTGAGSNGNSTSLESTNSNSSDEVRVIRNSYTGVRNMFVEFAVRNGGSANVPLLAGTYVFKFTATIEAGL